MPGVESKRFTCERTMRVVINHLTRMQPPYVCIAGVDEGGRHKRPVLDVGRPRRELLASGGGPFSLGAVVDLGDVQRRPTPPEVEDVVFDPQHATTVGHWKPSEFLQLLQNTAEDSLGSIFGADLVRKSGTAAAVPVGNGNASLGVLRLKGAELVSQLEFAKPTVRLRFEDPVLGELSIKVTDLRLWEADQTTPAVDGIDEIRSDLDECLIAVGLTRPFQVSSYPGVWHWLQVNNVFPTRKPLWARE